MDDYSKLKKALGTGRLTLTYVSVLLDFKPRHRSSSGLRSLASGPICLALGASGIGGVLCVAAIVGTGAWLGTEYGGEGGEWAGEMLYEKTLP